MSSTLDEEMGAEQWSEAFIGKIGIVGEKSTSLE
jgi:hypothetical protein